MTPEQVITHYKTQQAAGEAVGVSQSAVSAWLRRGLVPELQQLRYQLLTKGTLVARAEKSVR